MNYDADAPVAAERWLAADADTRRLAVEQAHEGVVDALHPASLRRGIHIGLHATVETMVAQQEPHVLAAIERITGEGVRRHAAVHMVMDVFAQRMSSLATPDPWSPDRWRQALERLDPADWIGRRMARDLHPGATSSGD